MNLACACRYLEEPVLSILWEKQKSLRTLLVVLPVETWGIEDTRWNAGYTVRSMHLPLPKGGTKARVTPVQDCGGSAAGGLGQGLALRVLDARTPCE